MDESAWLACTDREKLLDALLQLHDISDRKLRLYACGCVRQVWHVLAGAPRSQEAVEYAERMADGERQPVLAVPYIDRPTIKAHDAINAAHHCCGVNSMLAARIASGLAWIASGPPKPVPADPPELRRQPGRGGLVEEGP